jgi:hypothetical protein
LLRHAGCRLQGVVLVDQHIMIDQGERDAEPFGGGDLGPICLVGLPGV